MYANNPFASHSHQKSNSMGASTAGSNPLQSLRKGLLMSTVVSPINSGIIHNNSAATSFSAYDGSKVQ